MQFCLLIARQRSGTGLLNSLHARHRGLMALAEIFHPMNLGQKYNYFTFVRERLQTDPDAFMPGRREENLLGFLDSLSPERGERLPCIDVKYSSLHHVNGEWHSPLATPWIVQFARARGCPIIHLKRANFVETFVSGQLADANQVWHTSNLGDIKIRSVPVDPGNLLSYLASTGKEVDLVTEWLSGHRPLVELEYATMLEADGAITESACCAMAEALGVGSFQERSAPIVKQSPATLRDSIANFDEIVAALSSTPYAWMIEGD